MEKTIEEVQRLKDNWLKDPCYDLAQTPGYKEYAVELAGFQMEHEGLWRAAREKREAEAYRNTPASEATLRDVIATHALQGMLAHSRGVPPHGYRPAKPGQDWHQAIAEESYQLSDAMMAARRVRS